MTEIRGADRRTSSAPPRAPARAGVLRRLGAALRAGLYRPLAGDDDRVAYWVRHVRIGVLLSEIAALSVIGYVLITDSPARNSPVVLGMCALVLLTSPLLLLLPLADMMRDSRGPTMFYLWSIATSTLVIIGTRIDGGPSSPLDALLFLTLTFLAVAYSPYGVVLMGGLMTVAYLFFVELPGLTTSGMFFLTIMASFTMVCALASANSWSAYDRRVELIRAQEMLAATDPLTGIPNRRAYLERVADAVDAAAWGHQTVVCPRRPRRVQGRQRRRRPRCRRRDALRGGGRPRWRRARDGHGRPSGRRRVRGAGRHLRRLLRGDARRAPAGGRRPHRPGRRASPPALGWPRCSPATTSRTSCTGPTRPCTARRVQEATESPCSATERGSTATPRSTTAAANPLSLLSVMGAGMSVTRPNRRPEQASAVRRRPQRITADPLDETAEAVVLRLTSGKTHQQ